MSGQGKLDSGRHGAATGLRLRRVRSDATVALRRHRRATAILEQSLNCLEHLRREEVDAHVTHALNSYASRNSVIPAAIQG